MPAPGETKKSRDGKFVATWNGAEWVENPVNEAGLEQLDGGYLRNAYGATFKEGPRGGINQVGGPSNTKADEYGKELTGLNTALAGIDRVDRQLAQTKGLGPMGWFTNPTDLAVLNQSVKDLQLRLKEQPYNLGVLNGPDLDILESVVANPNQLKSAAFRQTLQPRLKNLSAIIGEQYRGKAQSFDAVGGRSSALPPLYRSPRSQYSADEWGHDGRVPAKKDAPAGQAAGVFKGKYGTVREVR